MQVALSILFAAIFFAGSGTAMNLRLGSNTTMVSSNEESPTITVPDEDLLGIGSYVVVAIDGYELKDMSVENQAILECAIHKAFDDVHGDRDGIYLTGQRIIATAQGEEEEDDGPRSVGFRKYKRRKDIPEHIRKMPWNHPDAKKFLPWKVKEKTWVHKVNWMDTYTYWSSSGRCNMCPDDDATETNESLLLANDLSGKKARNEQIAAEFIEGETSLNAVADALLVNLIQGACIGEGDDTFTYTQHAAIVTLTQEEFEKSIAEIRATSNLAELSLFPFYYNTEAFSNSTSAYYKIGLSGVGCGAWNNQDLFDINSALHDSINALDGFWDKGHVVDKIVTANHSKRRHRRYSWKCDYDVYAKVDMEGGDTNNEYSFRDIEESLCANLFLHGSAKFETTIDCSFQPLTASEYGNAIAASSSVGVE